MAKAIAAIKDKTHTYSQCLQLFGIPRSTLERRVKDRNKIAVGVKKMMGNMTSVLPEEIEDSLAEYILKMEAMLMGLGTEDVRRLARELAERNNVNHPFPTEMAGLTWFQGFMRRYPRLSIRIPENTSHARAKAFNATNVAEFFSLYKGLLEKYSFSPNRIYNVDEKGVSTVHNNPPKILSLKGKKQVGCIASGERGVNTTLVLCGNALGTMVPPLFVFPRVKNNPLLLRGAPTGSVQHNALTGWIQTESFVTWLKHFISFTGSTEQNPTFVILDGHATHVKSLEVVDIARSNGVHIICLPPHSTHRMQPLDVTLMKPLSSKLAREYQLWLRANPGQSLTIYHIAELFNKAYLAACVPETLIKGFEKTGLYPLNPDVFAGQFSASEVTDLSNPSNTELPPAAQTSSGTLPQGTPTSSGTLLQGTPTSSKTLPQGTPSSSASGTLPQGTPTSSVILLQGTPTSSGTLPQGTPTSSGTLPEGTPTSSGILLQGTPTSSGTLPQETPASSASGTLPQGTPTSSVILLQGTPTSSGTLPQGTPTSSGTLPQGTKIPAGSLPPDTPISAGTLPPDTPISISALPPGTLISTSRVGLQKSVLAHDIASYPVVDQEIERSKRGKSRAGKTAVITSSPYRKCLIEDIEKKDTVEENKSLKRSLRELKKLLKANKIKIPESLVAKKVIANKVKKAKQLTYIADGNPNHALRIVNNPTPDPDSTDNPTGTDDPVHNSYPTDTLTHGPAGDSDRTSIDDPAFTVDPVATIESGTFIVVKFDKGCKKKGKPVYYVGYVMSLKGDVITKKFTRRADLKKRASFKFSYPTEDDISHHPRKDVYHVLPTPTVMKGTARTESMLVFNDRELEKFKPLL